MNRWTATIASVALVLSTPTFSQSERDASSREADCDAKGGIWMRVGKLQRFGCVIPSKDAKKPCSDSSQCQFRCIYQGRPDFEGDRAVGFCSVNSSIFGCYGLIAAGKAQEQKCID
jgi:hypothetical protein